ncbi:MAG TPA: hypothetical protein VIT23_13200 [Terrimicrobiaceae bacterium]
MDAPSSLLQLGLGFLILTVALGFSVKAAGRYPHVGIALLCGSLGIEALGMLLSFLTIALDPGKFSFLLWSSTILRYIALSLLLAGWILLALSSKSLEPSGSEKPMISGANFARWAILGVFVMSVLAALWSLLMIFATGMKAAPQLTAQEAFTAALPSLVLLPASVGLSILSIRWEIGRTFLTLGSISSLINLACAAFAAVSYGSR